MWYYDDHDLPIDLPINIQYKFIKQLHSNLTPFKKEVNLGQPSAPSYILSCLNPHLNIL